MEYGDYEKYTDHPYTEVLQTCAKDSFMYSFNPDTYTLQNMCTRDDKGYLNNAYIIKKLYLEHLILYTITLLL